jgi:hypothetical protein
MSKYQSVYEPIGIDGFELCHPTSDDGFADLTSRINGESRSADWTPIPVSVIREDQGAVLQESDSPWFGSSALIFRPRAAEKLGTGLSSHGELLPLACDDTVLAVFNPTLVVDALDENASDILRFQDGRMMGVQRYVFHSAKIAGLEIFKLPNLRVSPTYVTEVFVDRWKLSGLRGLEFRRLWPNPTKQALAF